MDDEVKIVVGLGIVSACVLIFAWFQFQLMPGAYVDGEAGLIQGLFHGLTIVPNYGLSLFSDAYSVYEAPNAGWTYDTGYLMGLFMFFGIIPGRNGNE